MESNSTMDHLVFEPHQDMEFDSHDAAYNFYKEYAKSVGFGTAKLSSRRSRSSKEFIDAKFACIRYGNKQQSDDAINPRPSPKIGCKASMHVKRKANGKWHVYNFVKEHNHDLLPAQAHLFRSHRNADLLKNDVRVRRRKILPSVSKQSSAYWSVGYLDNLIRAPSEKGRSLPLENGDAQMLFDFLMQMQDRDSEFFYAVDLNEEQRLRNVLWVDGKALSDYAYFGDVVSIDTTYFTNSYKIPLVLFIGVNHHIQPTLLGCALIADETVHTFLWVIQTWVVAMGGRTPGVVLTAENSAWKEAIAVLLPSSHHCFSLWNIVEKMRKRLEYENIWVDNFMEGFHDCIYRSCTEEQFEKSWWSLLEKFKLQDDEWLRSLYEDRVRWVPVFVKGISFVGLSTLSRSQCLNSSYDKYVNIDTSLREFLEKYRTILEDRCEEEAKAEFDSWHENPELRSPSPFEKQMSWVYTHEIFKNFQVEVLGAVACHLKKESEDATRVTFIVKDFENNRDFIVEWDGSNSDIHCSCRLFEYQGYLCRHAIVVLQMSGVFSVPSKYILQRWTNAALSRFPIGEKLDLVQAKVRRYNDLCRRAVILAEESSLSLDSFDAAVCAIREALKWCQMMNVSLENDSRSDSNLVYMANGDVEDNRGSNSMSFESDTDMRIDGTDTGPRRPGYGKEKAYIVNNASSGTAILNQGVTVAGSQHGLTRMETPSARPAHLHNMFPVHHHNVASNIFQRTPPAQLHHTTWQEKHLHP